MEIKKSKSYLGLVGRVRRMREIRLEKMIEEVGRVEVEDDEE